MPDITIDSAIGSNKTAIIVNEFGRKNNLYDSWLRLRVWLIRLLAGRGIMVVANASIPIPFVVENSSEPEVNGGRYTALFNCYLAPHVVSVRRQWDSESWRTR